MGLTKILIANRGEIALRVCRTARRLGYRTVAVYSSADATAPHVAAADEAVCLGPAPAADSYLAGDKVIQAARLTGADALHPGYGFLAENADFARACAAAGITFIGPPVAALELMGNKRAAKVALTAAGVGCIPGYEGEQDDDTLTEQAAAIGYPVMVKAAAGGGGKGMRLVTAPADLADALRAARAEARSAFGDAELILEKALIEARHVEVQIFGDTHGNIIHLGERDCSIQRRHQKVIEESPSPAVDAELRRRMGAQAVAAARSCGYVGAGTVELLLDRDGRFYFLEMNTRLQVEHPVTELVTGIDLVAWQIRIAEGEVLPITAQADIELRGHAIEARLYAEDPASGYLPQTGEVLVWQPPADTDVRIDHGVREGSVISAHYDPLIAKVIAHGQTRDEARRKLAAALRRLTLLGVVTNKALLANVCEHPVFAAGAATTAFLAQHFEGSDPCASAAPPPLEGFATAALAVLLEGAQGIAEDDSLIGWRSGGPAWATVKLEHRDTEVELRATAQGRSRAGYRFAFARAGGAEPAAQVELELLAHSPREIVLSAGGTRHSVRWALARGPKHVWIDDGDSVRRYADVTHRPAAELTEAGSGRLSAPLDGGVMKVFVAVGDTVEAGELVMVIEAMKMEHRILADVAGTVSAVLVGEGEQVQARQLLAAITAG